MHSKSLTLMHILRIFIVLLAGVATAGCEAIGDIFQAGMATGVIIVVLIIAVLGFLVSRMRR